MTRADQQTGANATAQTGQEIIATGTLAYGVAYGGRRHYDFAMRLPTIGDNIDALEALPQGSVARIDLTMFAACMERLGEIPADEMTYELLASMDPADLDVIYEKVGEAKKKLLRLNDGCELTEKSSSSWEDMASPRTESVV